MRGAARVLTRCCFQNAWPVNFNLALPSFGTHIAGAVALLNLCLAEGAAFFFSSSISCRQGAPDATCAEDFAATPATAAGTGYARSKWVVEKLLERAGAHAPGLTVGALRIGQMVGDTEQCVPAPISCAVLMRRDSGVWNETEAWPLMIKGAQTLGALPLTTERPSWLPVDCAARAITEIVRARHAGAHVYHVVNPDTSASWDDLLAALRAAGLRFDAVPVEEWLARLRTGEQDPDRNPVVKLLVRARGRAMRAGRCSLSSRASSRSGTRACARRWCSAPARRPRWRRASGTRRR